MKRKWSRTLFLVTILMLLLIAPVFVPACAAPAKPFPSQTIHWIVQYSPGGGFDTVARGLVPYIQQYLPNKVDIVIDNIPGAGGGEGLMAIYKAKPDGYTVGWLDPLSAEGATLITKPGFDIAKFNYVAKVGAAPNIFVAAKNSPYNSIADFKKATKPITFACQGVADVTGLIPILAGQTIGFNYKLITGYGGTSDMAVAVMRGDADIMGTSPGVVYPSLQSGAMKMLVTLNKNRDPNFKDVPTIREAGFPQFEGMGTSRFVITQDGVPADRKAILEDAFFKAVNDKNFVKWGAGVNQPIEGQMNAADAKADAQGLITLFESNRALLEKAAKETAK